jgi:hypothetical protein
LVSGNWRNKAERATLDRNYVLCILLGQEQRCFDNARPSNPGASNIVVCLFAGLAHALDDFAGHMDLDQFAPASLSQDHKIGVDAFVERRKLRWLRG